MKQYTLKLKSSGTNYNYALYEGGTLISDNDLATLFASAGQAYFFIDHNGYTPSYTNTMNITDSQGTQIIAARNLYGDRAVNDKTNHKGTWTAGASSFSAFDFLPGRTLDEAELTDLMGKIKEGSIKTLTSADVNYPANDPTKISLYSLDYGVYKIIGPVSIVFGNSSTSVQSGFDRTAVVMPGNGTYKTIGWGYNVKDLEWKDVYSDTGSSGSAYTGTISDSLNYSSVEHPLSAKQGKVLNEKIGDLSTLTTTAKTSAVAALNELDSDKEGKTITGSAAPTTATVADNVGQKYYDSTNDKWYVCKAITPGVDPDPTTYTWVEQAGGPTVVQTTGTSTTDVMSQNAVTSMVYANPGTNTQIRIGSNASATGPRAVAIGGHEGNFAAVASGQGSLALGVDSIAGAKGAISFSYSRTSVQGVVQFGISTSGSASGQEGYKSSHYRLISGLYDGQSDHDAATVGQLPATLTISQFNSIIAGA